MKKAQGEDWDRTADLRQERNFKYLLVLLSSTLDQFAELCAIYFHEQLKDVRIGRAQFTAVVRALKREFELPTIASPVKSLYAGLRDDILQLLTCPDRAADADWFDVFVLYRNKLAHLGSRMFPVMQLPDGEGNFYPFTPREWTIFHQTGLGRPATDETIGQFIERHYIDIDMLEYAQGIVARVNSLLELEVSRICEVFTTTKDWTAEAVAASQPVCEFQIH